MTYDDFNSFCASLPAAAYVVQWGGSHVWKAGGKVFAIGGWNEAAPSFTFKVTPIAFEILKDRPGLRPAPYLASRGLLWIQHYAAPGLADEELKDFIRQSYTLVIKGLPKRRKENWGYPQMLKRDDSGLNRIPFVMAAIMAPARY